MIARSIRNLFKFAGGSPRGFAIWPVVSLIGLISLAVVVLAFIFGEVVNPGWMGIRQVKLGPARGFSKESLTPGYHWSIPGYSTIHFIPQTMQILNLHKGEGVKFSGFDSLEVQTSDRASVDVDVSILYSFFSNPSNDHGGPVDLLRNVGIHEEKWRNHIRRTVEDELKRALGKISTGEFYDPFQREERLQEAEQVINRLLAKDGISVDNVLLRRYVYRESRIDQAIFQKNLQDQEERLNVTASRLAEAQAQLEQVAAEWDAKIETLRTQGDNRVRILRSEGDLYEARRRAEADLEVAKAAAESDRLKTQALNQAATSDLYIAREIAPILGTLKGGVVSNVDPYDMKTWMKKLGVQTE